MILGKMYCETATKRRMAELWLKRAEEIATLAGNAVNLADIHNDGGILASSIWFA
ncbi:MAG: hypothetical protein M3O31_02105 [Acidobacteriota bacterium]|nr:hypothetical protein [Acidobacteriota bacterium]